MTAAARRQRNGSLLMGALTAILVAVSAGEAAPQDGRTQELARRLTSLLEERKLDSVAARDPNASDSFVAALYFPNSQLLVVQARYAAPALLYEKILQGNYRDVYIDLNAASDPATKVLVEDLMADGLRARRENDQPFDIYTEGQGERYSFDGDWRRRRIREEEYFKTFDRAEEQYAHMLEALIAQLSQAGTP